MDTLAKKGKAPANAHTTIALTRASQGLYGLRMGFCQCEGTIICQSDLFRVDE
jgi:hypothetical protein